ncbi:MAG: hypothetical protein A2073_05485 [Deltaproteobacteria bacterium GWC2_42_11]|nr:MAG: hypothetical protein A2073_05485 [Deltaproteobacteria bacterium GWC2_42_11]HBO84872.1 hypothetical protein [Deltaproteobacteria bacterium]
MKKFFILFLLFTIHYSLSTAVNAGDIPTKPKPAATPEMLAKGKTIYFKRCSFCHGLIGDGNGPAADFMDPRPRDFTIGTFKFRTTASGELPTDEDLFKTISRGLSGTGMQAFDIDKIKNGLTEEERWQVIYYIKTFAPEFSNKELDPYKSIVKPSSSNIPFSKESVEKGKVIFEKTKCWECHGKGGKGDGVKEERKDDWGFPIRIRNVTQPWKIKAGSESEDIFMRFSTGINGTPMPSFIDSLKEEERWHLANFIKSLQYKPNDQSVLKAKQIKGDIPMDFENPVWAKSEVIDIRLAGQVIAAPRWQNPSIDMVTVRAVYNEKEIGFLLEWDDPFKDVIHNESLEFDPKDISSAGAYNSYVDPNKMAHRKLETFRDSIALQFPIKMPEGTKRPHFFRGDAGNPINIWLWKADMDVSGKTAVEENIGTGFKQPLKVQDAKEQQVVAKSLWNGGRWKVIIKRPILTPDKNDTQFEKGKFIPFSLNAWDGSNGEHNLLMSLSTWNYVILETSTPATVWLWSLFGIIGMAGVEIWIVRRIKKP